MCLKSVSKPMFFSANCFYYILFKGQNAFVSMLSYKKVKQLSMGFKSGEVAEKKHCIYVWIFHGFDISTGVILPKGYSSPFWGMFHIICKNQYNI